MKENKIKIPANNSESTLYCFLGVALLKTQMLEQALSYSITLKMNPDETKDRADEFLKQRNWLVHSVVIGNEENFNAGNIKEELLQKIKSISDRAEAIKRLIEYDLIDFCSSKGKDMSKILEILKLEEKGIRIRK